MVFIHDGKVESIMNAIFALCLAKFRPVHNLLLELLQKMKVRLRVHNMEILVEIAFLGSGLPVFVRFSGAGVRYKLCRMIEGSAS